MKNSTKELKNKIIAISISFTSVIAIIIIAIIILVFQKKNNAEISKETTKSQNTIKAKSSVSIETPIKKQDKSKAVNLDDVIAQNEKDIVTEKIEKQETDVEFSTQYRNNDSLAKGKIQTIQEGQDGKQNAIIKSVYKNGELISNAQISSEITKVSIDKIVEVGTASFSNNYVPIVGDTLKVTSNSLAIHTNPDQNANKLITIDKDSQVTLKAKQGDWFYVAYQSFLGWAPKDCLTYVNPNANGDGDENNVQYTKEQLSQSVGFSMLVNKKSNLSLEQFKKIFENDSNDKNNVFKENAEYFYYVEQQYNINGLFVAAIAIHESGWGTSSISQNKKNLFGYRAYDRDPSGSASGFGTYAEGIDLVSRVLVKYYLNPAGTSIYGGEKAVGTYYRGSTITAVNQCYASDKNWANAVYKWMLYLYNKL